MDRIKLLREQIEEMTDQAQALINLADAENRDLTADEQREWDGIMDAETGQLAAKQTELELLEKRAAEAKRLAAQRRAAQRSVFDNALDAPAPAAPNVALIRSSLRAFKNTPEGRQAAYDSGMWLRAVHAHSKGYRDEAAQNYAANRFGAQIFATQTKDPGQAGGYMVPDPLSAAFIEFREAAGISRQLCDVRPMTSDTLSIPKLTSGPAVRYPGEAASITTSDQVWGQILLTANKRAILTKISSELVADAIVNVVDQLVSRMAFEFALQEDNELLNGDSTSTYGGELGLLAAVGTAGRYYAGGSSTSTKDTWGEIVMADFTNTMGLLPTEHWSNPAWICSAAFFYGPMLTLLANAGGNTMPILQEGTMRPMFLGYPVFLSDKMPTATGTDQKSVLFGTFSDAAVIGDRETLSIAFSDQRYFDEDVTAVRGVTRYDINVHNAGTASVVGAYTTLATSAS